VEILVTYDVATETAEGRRRLRRVAKICEGFGQRVQKSVFECIVNGAELEMLEHHLLSTIDHREDSLRMYRLREPRERFTRVIGHQPAHDVRDPLIL
jgi:CRISPR-associated protein Cas2